MSASAATCDVLAFSLDSVADLAPLIVRAAYDAAGTLWPERVVGGIGRDH